MAGRPSDKQKELEAKKLLEELGYELIPNGYFKCIATNKILSVKQGHFYQTKNKMYSGCISNTDGNIVQLLPYSKKWIMDRYTELTVSSNGNEKLAMYKLCMDLRIPWVESHWEDAVNNKMNNIKYYIGKMNSLPQVSSLTMNDSESYIGDNSDLNSDIDIKHKKISKKNKEELIKFWGGFSDEELLFLEDEYDDWNKGYTIDTKSLKVLIKEICYKQLGIKILREEGQSTSKELKDLQDLMSSSALKPVQESSAMNNEANTLGVWIKKIENEEPIEEVREEYRDVDGIGKMIRIFFLGHFNKMLGIKNELSEEYEKEMSKYTVTLNEDGD